MKTDDEDEEGGGGGRWEMKNEGGRMKEEEEEDGDGGSGLVGSIRSSCRRTSLAHIKLIKLLSATRWKRMEIHHEDPDGGPSRGVDLWELSILSRMDPTHPAGVTHVSHDGSADR